MIGKVPACAIAGAVLASLALAAEPAWAQSEPPPEMIRIFDRDAIRYPALTVERMSLTILQWKDLLEEGKRNLKEAEDTGNEKTAEAYRTDIREIEKHIADLETAAAGPQPAADGTPTGGDDAQPTLGQLWSRTELQVKLAQVRQMATMAVTLAKNGRYSDVRMITGLLEQTLGAARQAGLVGDEKNAKWLWARAVETVKVFSNSFAETCSGQSSDRRFVEGLDRQNQLIGNSIDLEPCKYRLYSSSGLPDSGWRHCGTGLGTWYYRDDQFFDSAKASGSGEISADSADNKFSYRVTGPDADVKIEGRLELRHHNDDPELALYLFEHRDSASGRHHGSDVSIDHLTREDSWSVSELNDNMPCDPSKDVWSY
jgi:hypothetical protein